MRLQPLRRAFGRPLRLLRRHRLGLLVGAAAVPLHAAVTLWMPRLLGEAVDLIRTTGAGAADARAALAGVCWSLFALALAEAGTRFLSRKLLIDVSRYVERDLKDLALAHLQTLPIAWHDRARTGDLVSRLTQDVELVRFVMGPLLLHGGSTLCLLPAGVWMMARLDVPVTLAAATAFVLLFAGLRLLMPRLQRWSKKTQEAIGDLSQRAQEDFAGIRVLWNFGAEAREEAALATHNRRYLLANLRLVRLRALVHAITHSTSGLVTLAVLVVGGHQVLAGTLTIGQMFQFTAYLGLMLFPLEILGWTISMLPRAHAAAIRIEELFELAPEVGTGAAPPLRGHLRVQGLTFTYPGQARPALVDIAFELPPGGKLGLVGPVGSGKSTLLALLLRFYDPPRGTVFVDGHDVLDLAPAALRATFAMAAQEPFLFSDTVRANVAFGHGTAGTDDLDRAVADAALDQDLPQLPAGLETRVGERGVTLSGGQKQRVSLARALVAGRPALLLDDTLSAVDPATEQRILAGLQRQRRGRSVLVASHRLSVVADADLVLVLDAGRIAERGTCRDLVAQGGAFAAAWRRQGEADALESDGGDA